MKIIDKRNEFVNYIKETRGLNYKTIKAYSCDLNKLYLYISSTKTKKINTEFIISYVKSIK